MHLVYGDICIHFNQIISESHSLLYFPQRISEETAQSGVIQER